MRSPINLYRLFNTLSLDVALGAVICAAAFAKVFDVHVLPQGFIVLGIAVWMIYTVDHLLDAKQLKGNASTYRHRFHQEHFKLLVILVIICALIELTLIFFLRKPVFHNGLWLGLGVCVYIIINRWLHYFKEVAGALLYSSGVLLPALSLNENTLQLIDRLLIAEFVLVALINLVLFSWMDYERDIKDKHKSLITLAGKQAGVGIIYFLSGVLVVLTLVTVSTHFNMTIVLAFMTMVLIFIFRFSTFFNQKDRFRYLGDAIFFLPAIMLMA
jgi:4-hydroxybenzoate polyprenyltransferase